MSDETKKSESREGEFTQEDRELLWRMFRQMVDELESNRTKRETKH